MSQREEAWITPLNLIQYFEHFRSFDRVESLTLSYFSCRVFDRSTLKFLFRNLIPSVHKLRLHRPIACPTSLLRFISIFPNLQDTLIHAPHWEPMTQRDHHATAPYHLHGELYLSGLEEESGPFLSLLGSQRSGYERITLDKCGFYGFLPLQQLISSAGMSLRKLYLFAEGDRKFGPQILISGIIITLMLSSPDRREVPKISLSECAVLESLFISVVGPEASFHRIISMCSSVVSPHLRKLTLEATLRDFPDIYCSVVQNALVNGVSRLDRPLCTLAKRIIREDEGGLLFILLSHNALRLAQRLTELNREGDMLVGEKVVGGEHSCVYIPAMTPLQEVLDGKAGRICNVDDFL